jgi:hypothetical protein
VVILSAWGVIPYCKSADIAEAIACLEGLKASMYYVAGPLIMECDNAMVVQELKDKRSSKSAISGIIGDIKNLMSFFIDQNVCKINRSANCVAHNLASFGRREGSKGVLKNAVPPCVAESVQVDCVGVCNKHLVI